MDGRRRAVFVGVNQCPRESKIVDLRYAEADAIAMRDLLTEETTGTFDPADVVLLTGRDATSAAVKQALRSAAMDSEPADILFVFFAGHGVLPPWQPGGDPFLAMTDTSMDEFSLEPERGLRMGFLRRDVFEIAEGSSFLVLDCCHAGGFTDSERMRAASGSLQHAIGDIYLRQLNRHSALLACPKDQSTRERDDLRQGVFTHYLLRGLTGGAAGPDGSVTFEQLASFIASQGLHPPPGLFVHGWGRTCVLTNPGLRVAATATPGFVASSAADMRIVSSGNALDRFVGPLIRLLDRAFRQGHWPLPDGPGAIRSRLELIRFVTGATMAGLVALGSSTVEVEAATDTAGIADLPDVLGAVGEHIASNRHGSLGYQCHLDPGGVVLAVPVAQAENGQTACLVVVNPDDHFLAVGEPLATLLRALWCMQPTEDALFAEFKVLTALRQTYGRLPLNLYHYGLQAYSQLINSLVMVFEPVMSLGPRVNQIGVHTWEALARRHESDRRAPLELLEVAHAWGDQFIIERDRALATKAILSYAFAHNRSVYQHDTPAPISINVAVRSLINDTYADAVGAAISEAGMGPHSVTLEISERDPIAPRGDEVWAPSAATYFQSRLSALAQRLRVNFAVDDFGVGYASLDRLATFHLTQIKVDRAILHHPLALDELDLVVRVAEDAVRRQKAFMPRTVVVEGFDEHAPISLRDIYMRGIRYVQGYITEAPASTTLRPLSQDLRTRIAAQLEG